MGMMRRKLLAMYLIRDYESEVERGVTSGELGTASVEAVARALELKAHNGAMSTTISARPSRAAAV
jgi:hypothetical protein